MLQITDKQIIIKRVQAVLVVYSFIICLSV